MRNFKATTEQEYVRATGRLNNFTKVAEVKLAASKKSCGFQSGRDLSGAMGRGMRK